MKKLIRISFSGSLLTCFKREEGEDIENFLNIGSKEIPIFKKLHPHLLNQIYKKDIFYLIFHSEFTQPFLFNEREFKKCFKRNNWFNRLIFGICLKK